MDNESFWIKHTECRNWGENNKNVCCWRRGQNNRKKSTKNCPTKMFCPTKKSTKHAIKKQHVLSLFPEHKSFWICWSISECKEKHLIIVAKKKREERRTSKKENEAIANNGKLSSLFSCYQALENRKLWLNRQIIEIQNKFSVIFHPRFFFRGSVFHRNLWETKSRVNFQVNAKKLIFRPLLSKKTKIVWCWENLKENSSFVSI
jgi:hypothetical protein